MSNIPLPSSAGRRSGDQVARLRRLATLLDGAVGIPGTPIRFGLDALVGLVPGVGDLVGGMLSMFIVISGARLGLPASTIGRMLVNIAIDTAVGTVPVLGDVFDAGWKSNLRNVDLIERHLGDPVGVTRRSRWVVVGVVLAGLLVIAAAIALVVALWQLVGRSAS